MKMKSISEHDSAQLSALLDDTLPAAQAAALHQRLQQDEALQEAFTELALVRDTLRALPVAPPPRSLRIDPQRLQQARGWRWWLVMPPAGQLIPSMAVALSLCVCILFGQQAFVISSEPETLKGAAMAADAAPAPDAQTLGSITDAQVLAPSAADMAPWLWAGTGAGAGASVGSAWWAWRVAARRRVTRKR